MKELKSERDELLARVMPPAFINVLFVIMHPDDFKIRIDLPTSSLNVHLSIIAFESIKQYTPILHLPLNTHSFTKHSLFFINSTPLAFLSHPSIINLQQSITPYDLSLIAIPTRVPYIVLFLILIAEHANTSTIASVVLLYGFATS